MKGILIMISGMMVLVSGTVYGQSDTPVVDQQQTSQENWIERSFDRGQFNHRDAVRPGHEQDRLERREKKENVDGERARKDTARTGAKQKRAPRPLVRERHNRQGARHR